MLNIYVKKKKVIYIFIMFIILFQVVCPTVYASLADSARSESGPAPTPETPPDNNPNIIPNNSDNTEIYYTEISGTVYEDLGKIKVVSKKENENQLKPIKGIRVNLYNSSGTLVDWVRTDDNGKYSFKPEDGTYYTEFWYGDTDNANFDNREEIKNILKYNGHDYITVKTPEEQEYIDSEKFEVINSAEGALQLYLAIDCSYSMRTQQIGGKTKLQFIADAAEKLCDSLINLDENIYIGLVFFSGTNYRAVSLTKNKDVLNQALEDIKANGWNTPNTDIFGAISKVKDSYYYNDKDKSNRYLVLLSDGLPTSDGNTIVYNDDSDDIVIDKINSICLNTKNKLKELKNDGINIFSLFTKSDDEEENKIVENTFKENSTIFENIENINSTVKIIENTLNNAITNKVKSLQKHYSNSNTILRGYEDENRRREVDSVFNNNNLFNYRNTIIFDQINNYNNKDLAKKLSDFTKIKVIGGKQYIIRHLPNPPYREVRNEQGILIKTIRYVEGSYSNQDVWLARRPEFTLLTNITATKSQIVLAENVIYKEEIREVGAGRNDFILQYAENEMLYGAKVEIEYTINIKNPSSIQCEYLELLVQIPEGFKYKDGTCNYPISRVSAGDLLNERLITEQYNNQLETYKIILNNEGKGKDGFYISPGGYCNISLTVTRIAGGFDDKYIEDIKPISAEILQYKNANNKRMTETIYGRNVLETRLGGIYPGDRYNIDYSNDLTNAYVIIIPPTGEFKNKIHIYALILIILLHFVILISIKNKKI